MVYPTHTWAMNLKWLLKEVGGEGGGGGGAYFWWVGLFSGDYGTFPTCYPVFDIIIRTVFNCEGLGTGPCDLWCMSHSSAPPLHYLQFSQLYLLCHKAKLSPLPLMAVSMVPHSGHVRRLEVPRTTLSGYTMELQYQWCPAILLRTLTVPPSTCPLPMSQQPTRKISGGTRLVINSRFTSATPRRRT